MMEFIDSVHGLPPWQRVGVVLFVASTLGMGTAWLAASLLWKRSAALRCQIWLAGFVSVIVFAAVPLSGIALRVPVLHPLPPAHTATSQRVAVVASPLPSASSDSPPTGQKSPEILPPAPPLARKVPRDVGFWLTGLWGIGIGVGIIRILAGLAGLSACARSAIPPAANGNVARLTAELESLRSRVRLHPRVHSPISFGWWRTWIILPSQAEGWSMERLHVVLRHEQAHGERGDFSLTFLARTIATLCWLNPLVWLGLRRFRELVEDATDDRVAMATDATTYGEELFQLLRDLRTPPRGYGLALSITHGSSARTRIARLLDEWIDRASPTRAQTLFVLTTAVVLAVLGGALRFVRAEGAEPATARLEEEGSWTAKLNALRVPTAGPEKAPKPQDFESPAAYAKANRHFWEAYWAVEYPRLWNLAETEREFLQRFPHSAEAPAVQTEMIDSILSCLLDQGSTGKQALAWVNEILAQRDLSPAVALPIYKYQMNMIGIIAGGGSIDSLVPVPRDGQDVDEAIDELLAQFAKRFPGTPELGRLYFSATSFVKREDSAKVLSLIDQAKLLVTTEKDRASIDGARFRLTAKGKPAPALTFTALDGRKVDLAALKGKVVLLDFWATWCEPCVKKMPEIQNAYGRWKNDGLEVIGISLDSSRETLLKFVEKNRLPWPQYFDGKGWESDVAGRFGVQAIPSVWIIDQQGLVAAVAVDDPMPILERLLGPGQGLSNAGPEQGLPNADSGQGLPNVAPAPAASFADRKKGKGVMTIHAVDADGKPLAGVDIHHSVWTDEKFKANQDYTTDGTGNVTFTLPSSMKILRLWASKDGFVPAFANWEVTTKNQVTFPEDATFKLSRGGMIGGFVVDEKGAPIPGAKVEVSVSENDYEGSNDTGLIRIDTTLAYGDSAPTTDSLGYWSLNNAPTKDDPVFQIRLNHQDFVADPRRGKSYQTLQTVTTAQLQAQTARMVMARGISVEGIVTDPSGKPIEKAVVIRGNDPYRDDDAQRDEVRTDAAGKYRFTPSAPGTITITVVAPGWSPEQKEMVIGPSIEPINFQLKPGNALRIQFVDEADKPLPLVSVSLETWQRKRALYNIRHPNVMDTQIPNRADKNGIYEWTWAPEDIVKYTFWLGGYQTVENRMLAPGEYRIQLSK